MRHEVAQRGTVECRLGSVAGSVSGNGPVAVERCRPGDRDSVGFELGIRLRDRLCDLERRLAAHRQADRGQASQQQFLSSPVAALAWWIADIKKAQNVAPKVLTT